MNKNPLLRPKSIGLYDANYEHENCGVGFIAQINKKSSFSITDDALEMLSRMDHRGGCGCKQILVMAQEFLPIFPIIFSKKR